MTSFDEDAGRRLKLRVGRRPLKGTALLEISARYSLGKLLSKTLSVRAEVCARMVSR